jgi:hypothetical protein
MPQRTNLSGGYYDATFGAIDEAPKPETHSEEGRTARRLKNEIHSGEDVDTIGRLKQTCISLNLA